MSSRMRPPLVISVQSQVVYGHVGNSAALFPLQAAGLEVAAVPTVVFSNTPDYPTLRGSAMPPELFADLLLGAQERGLPQRAKFLLTGYIGSAAVARLTAAFVARCKQENPRLIYICDPVMGDHQPGLYVPAEIADLMRDELLPMANIATPNAFELAHLTGRSIETMDDLQYAVGQLRLAPEGKLVVTGCELDDTPADQLESILISPEETRRIPTRKIPIALPGTGDLFAAIVVAGLAKHYPLVSAIELAQGLTAQALAYAAQIDAREVVLSEPGFRRALVEI